MKLRKVRTRTITPSTPTLRKVGETATVRMMSAATKNSSPRKDLATLIKAKAIEEAVEYYWSEGQAEGAEELADLLELVRAGAS